MNEPRLITYRELIEIASREPDRFKSPKITLRCKSCDTPAEFLEARMKDHYRDRDRNPTVKFYPSCPKHGLRELSIPYFYRREMFMTLRDLELRERHLLEKRWFDLAQWRSMLREHIEINWEDLS